MANIQEQTLQQRNAELEKQLANKTIELNRKNRELEIETSLEHVRAQAMLMKEPRDLLEICKILFEELRRLGFSELRNTMININYDDKRFFLNYDFSESAGATINRFSYDSDMVIRTYLQKLGSTGDLFVENIISGDALKTWKEFRIKNGELPDPTLENIDAVYYYFYSISTGAVGIGNFQAVTEEQLEVLKRFRNVFDLAYRRYIDIEHAEKQAREVQIELALERVRAIALAMKQPADMLEICRVISSQLESLQVKDIRNVQTAIFNEAKGIYLNYEYYGLHDKMLVTEVDYTLHPEQTDFANKMLKSPEGFFTTHFEGKEVRDWVAYQSTTSQFIDPYLDHASSLDYYFYSIGEVALGISTYTPLNEENTILFKRFRNVFELAYRRYTDIEKAEAQAREARIEAALERVRSRTMTMQRSDELQDAANLLFKQVQELGIPIWSCGYNIFEKDENTCIGWISTEGFMQPSFRIPLKESQTFIRFVESRKKNEQFYVEEIGGVALEAHYRYMLTLPDFRKNAEDFIKAGYPFPSFQINHVVNFSSGNLIFISSKQIPEAWDVFKRFANVFEQTYIRFLDLKQAEAQTKEAKIESALERVRARALAMQTSNELLEVANTLREQMGILGIKELEASVVHLYYENAEIFDVCYAFRPAGLLSGEIVTGIVQFRIDECALSREFFEMYKSPVNEYTLEVKGDKLNEWLSLLLMKSPDLKKYWVQGMPQVGIYHFSNFSGGSLLMVSQQKPSEEACNLQRRAASVFDLAYRRFLDLQHKELQALKLLQEKQRLEHALAELHSTQSQLIQAEKMASLGELTAGIAHEIQNPLNFVNNFSEVSNELIDEMKTELDKGDKNEAIAIAKSLQENLEKILHHGKRADAIVKGMLQHSRVSGGQKEPTDINALADEYLRLAYHGLRAKDKVFNATIKTAFDNTIGKINIAPQDVGRMLLNIYNNAFYSVSKKKTQNPQGYDPIVSISTKKSNDKIEIRIKDNGNGIPQKILDKIFQPFFTTKPTGQGTGLGLSLAYDIVKAHGGEIKVETMEGEGAEFVVELIG